MLVVVVVVVAAAGAVLIKVVAAAAAEVVAFCNAFVKPYREEWTSNKENPIKKTYNIRRF